MVHKCNEVDPDLPDSASLHGPDPLSSAPARAGHLAPGIRKACVKFRVSENLEDTCVGYNIL